MQRKIFNTLQQTWLLTLVTSLVTSILSFHLIAADTKQITIDIGHAQLNAVEWIANDETIETVIALPGSGGDISRYKYIGPLIADAGYRVIAINQRGIMGSTGTLDNLTLHDYAADIAKVIDVLSLEKIHIVGWALGNRIARVLATDYPEKIASVTLIAAGGLVRPLTEPGELGMLLGQQDLPEDKKINLARRVLFSPASSTAIVREYVQGLKYWNDSRASQIQANRNTPLEQWWAGGVGPMLIVQGIDDKTAPPENGLRMQEEFGKRITLVNLPNAGHAMGLEKPAETADAIISFLEKHRF
ncbi:MAG: hypothetical protein COA96_00660 [SAR86 cluster bacterium]|uniref:AB hydrolase-1 domain-containing protein n=1 Tax=SAR86 cluster bacterium TaxID=2030880 RepID=A0A2A5BAZ7_9GAMM|nr:MAG: hypothetical protein COA96_00660 [SAR86 cluster bacterium]